MSRAAVADERVGWRETFGLASGSAWSQARIALAGQGDMPSTRFDATSLRLLKPSLSLRAWLGRRRRDRRVPVYNLFNHHAPPAEDGYSVRVTDVHDFRGRGWSYDSHVGTDFATPVGTVVVAPAPGRVVRVVSHLDRGGLKVCLDHGEGLFTTCGHLARAMVREGDVVGRGDPVGLSGASGIEFLLMFPWVAPHLHLNVWLDGLPVDPFARLDRDEPSMWRTGNAPRPYTGPPECRFRPTSWEPELVARAISACRDPVERDRLAAVEGVERRAAELLIAQNFRSPLFDERLSPYAERAARSPRLDLPFPTSEYLGAAFPDEE